jgi:hypothetical protein
MTRLRRPKAIDICLNLIFAVWLAYFIVSGNIVPSPLLRPAGHPPAVEKQQIDPGPQDAPVLLDDQDS